MADPAEAVDIKVNKAAAPSPTQDIVDRQAAIRNDLAALAQTLEEILDRVPRRTPQPLPADLGAAVNEKRFLPAMEALTAENERFLREAKARVAEIDALY